MIESKKFKKQPKSVKVKKYFLAIPKPKSENFQGNLRLQKSK